MSSAVLDNLQLNKRQERRVAEAAAVTADQKKFSTLVTSATIFNAGFFPNKSIPLKMAAEGNFLVCGR